MRVAYVRWSKRLVGTGGTFTRATAYRIDKFIGVINPAVYEIVDMLDAASNEDGFANIEGLGTKQVYVGSSILYDLFILPTDYECVST